VISFVISQMWHPTLASFFAYWPQLGFSFSDRSCLAFNLGYGK